MVRKGLTLLALAGILSAPPAMADLQKIQVGGQITIRGNYWSEAWFDQGPEFSRGPLSTLFGRPIPDALGFTPPFTFANGTPLIYLSPVGPRGLPLGLGGTLKFDDKGNSVSDVEQRTRVNFRADFTDGVTAFIELDSYDDWGQDFRSDYITGVDGRANSNDDVEVFQAYIDIQKFLIDNLSLRIGRQEIEFSTPYGYEEGWLLSNVDNGLFFGGVSFDAIRFDYAREIGSFNFSLTGFASKLAETSPVEEDGDVDFYGAEARLERSGDQLRSEFALYWLYLRDARSRQANPYLFQGTSPLRFNVAPAFGVQLLEDFFGVDDYDPTNLHTVGARVSGDYFPESLAWELGWKAEFAYQFGDADAIAFAQIPANSPINSIVSGALLPTVAFVPFLYGERDPEFDTYAGDISVLFRPIFGVQWLDAHATTIKLRFTYYDGEDNSDITFWERINPLATRQASVSFNRLFSEDEHSDFLDIEGNLSNTWIGAVEVRSQLTPEVQVGLSASYFEVVDEFERSPYGPFWDGLLQDSNGNGFLGLLSPITRTSDSDLGWELALDGVYDYSEDLQFRAGWTHFFAGDGIKDGNFVDLNGLGFAGGLDDEDADYWWFQASLKF